jgi:hypothetical protein
MRDRLVEFAAAIGIWEAEELSLGLMLLVDGVFVQRRFQLVNIIVGIFFVNAIEIFSIIRKKHGIL